MRRECDHFAPRVRPRCCRRVITKKSGVEVRSNARTLATALILASELLAAHAWAVNVAGTSSGFAWSAATGPVAGYAVQVSRGGGAFLEEARVLGTSTRVSGLVGETLVVRVAAYDVSGRVGAASASSLPITFTPVFGQGGDPAADLDANGVSDALAVDTNTGTLAALLLQTDGTRSWQVVGTPSRTSLRPVGYADVDGDGQADVLWRDSASGANEIWRLRGTNYSVMALPSQGSSWRVAAFRDFSGDGTADILFHSVSTGQSRLWTLSGAGRLAVLSLDPAPAGKALVAVADIDADGGPDLIWRANVTRALEAWVLSGIVPVASVALPTAPLGGSVAGVGDYDADGAEDLTWNVALNGVRSIHVWFMAGASAPKRGVALQLASQSWFRGVADLDSNGRDDLVLFGASGFQAFSVDPVVGSGSKWTTHALPLSATPNSVAWRFLILE